MMVCEALETMYLQHLAFDRLWRIDQIHKVEKEIKEVKKKFIYYSVSNITGQPSSQVLNLITCD